MSDAPRRDDVPNADLIRGLREAMAELEHRLRALGHGMLKHDAGNAVGAARNALVLLDEASAGERQERFVEMARRNVDRARRLLSGELADAPRALESAGNERNDLRRPREDDHGKPVGF